MRSIAQTSVNFAQTACRLPGVKKGTTYGESDDYSYNIVRDPVHVHDLNATIMHLLGINHERLNYKFQGLDMRLTGIAGNLVKGLLA
jgi:hypothetical protein